MASLYKNSIIRSLVLTLAVATAVPTASAHTGCMTEGLCSQAELIGTQLWKYLSKNPIKSSLTLALAFSLARTALKKPQREIKHHDNLGWEIYDNVICGQGEKEDGTRHFEDAMGSGDRPVKIKASGILGNALALTKPLAFAAGTFFILTKVFGLELPEFIMQGAQAAKDTHGFIK